MEEYAQEAHYITGTMANNNAVMGNKKTRAANSSRGQQQLTDLVEGVENSEFGLSILT